MLVIGYLLDSLLFGKYQFRGRNSQNTARRGISDSGRYTYVYQPNSEEKVGFDQYQTEEGNIKESELVRARRQSDTLLNVSFAGAIAIVLSFILPHLF